MRLKWNSVRAGDGRFHYYLRAFLDLRPPVTKGLPRLRVQEHGSRAGTASSDQGYWE